MPQKVMPLAFYPWCVKCHSRCKAFGKFGPFRVQRWRCRVCLETFSAGAVFRVPGMIKDVRKPEAFEKAKALFLTGYSGRQVAAMIGINYHTSHKYQKLVERSQPLFCACGESYKHKGLCAWRISLSPARQSWLARCNVQSTATRLARVESRQPILTRWPFVRSFDGDDYALMKRVNELVPRTMLEEVRQDVCPDILLDVISGKLFAEEIAGRVPEYIKRAYKFIPSKFGPTSLDDMIYSEGRETYADRLIG